MTPETLDPTVGHLLRDLAPQVLGAVTHRHGDFAAAEDAVQEALIAAATQWPVDGIPANPRGWLYHVAMRRITDHLRSELARRRREDAVASAVWADWASCRRPTRRSTRIGTIPSLSSSCAAIPALTPPSAIALTLRAIGGLTTLEIAKAFFVPEATMAQRISRAKASIKTSGVPFAFPSEEERAGRLSAVLHVLYLIFSEGYTSSSGPDLHRAETLWDQRLIAEGKALVSDALSRGSPGSYQLQAAIAAGHDEAGRVEDTDWPQILALYGLLERMSDNPMVKLNRAIAAAMVDGPAVGLKLLKALDADRRMGGHYRLDAVRGHLFEMAGDPERAIRHFRAAAERTASTPERNYLIAKAVRLSAEQDRRDPGPRRPAVTAPGGPISRLNSCLGRPPDAQ